MKKLKLYQTSSLNKTLINSDTEPYCIDNISCLKGEEVSYQIVYKTIFKPKYEDDIRFDAQICVDSEISDLISVKKIGNVPVELAAYTNRVKGCDDDYISLEPGLYPDPIFDIADNTLEIVPSYKNTRSLWVSVKTTPDTKAGVYPITITIKSEKEQIEESVIMKLEIIDSCLPKQEIIVTQWFHSECLVSYYGVEVFSERYWHIVEEFIKTAADNGINMILTPIITPPLDTEIGRERPTVQLVDIFCENGVYSFNFDKLDRWVKMCQKCGVEYFEMAHLFSQWGAKYTPKVVVCENGKCYNKFGWHTLAICEEYKDFLDQFLPSLTLHLKKLGIHEKTYFHISDEPNASNKDTYQKARNLVSKHLRDFKIIDCFSDFVLYKEGLVEKPIVGIDELQPFFDNNISDLWTYYCCSHTVDVSNRLMSMPSSRNRVIAYQLYKYNIEGFLQWGYNFYYTQFSRNAINPFYVTDAGNAFPAGDAFSVYPGDDKAIESIRLKVFKEALQDISAMKLLEKYISKEKVVELFEAEAGMKIEFNKYPRGDNFILNTREKINMLIKEYITK